MRQVQLMTPRKVIVGTGCSLNWIEDSLSEGYTKVILLSTRPIWDMLDGMLLEAAAKGLKVVKIDYDLSGEPTSDYFEKLRKTASAASADAIVGIGGGSVLDIAKLLAALADRKTPVSKCFGKNMLEPRRIGLYCLPTTSGTGSEVSPNAILLDSADGEKKGVISPYLLPDCTIIDPELTLSLPPKQTAETGMDALCHCVEAYMNKNAHTVVDAYAMKGVQLVYKNLLKAVLDGRNRPAREGMAIASMMGGLCLGPVNTCGVHALSYGLAGKYHLSHGLANALLLPEVMSFNIPGCQARISDLGKVLGVQMTRDTGRNAKAVVEVIRTLSAKCGIPQHLSELGVKAEDIPEMADMAMNVTRLLENNPREITREDAIQIYTNIL